MLKRLEDFLFGKVAGRVIARLAVSAAAFLAGQAAGVGIDLDPDQLSAALIAGANAAYTWLKDWRDKRAAAAKPAEAPAA
jgi:hypothetical protein